MFVCSLMLFVPFTVLVFVRLCCVHLMCLCCLLRSVLFIVMCLYVHYGFCYFNVFCLPCCVFVPFNVVLFVLMLLAPLMCV